MVETQQQWLMFGAMVIPIMEFAGLSLHYDGKPERAPLHDQNRIATMSITCRTILSMISFRSSIAKRHSFPAAESARVSDRRKTVGSTSLVAVNWAAYWQARKSLKRIMFMARSADGAVEPALL